MARTYDDARDIPEIKGWDDMYRRPRFARDVHGQRDQLARVLAPYRNLSPLMPCGLVDCHTANGSGYLIETMDGRETNIGADCGKKHFPEFVEQARAVDRIRNERELRTRAEAAKRELPRIRELLASVRQEHHGAEWVDRRYRALKASLIAIEPRLWTNLQRRAASGDAAVKKYRKRTKAERLPDQEFVTGTGVTRRVRADNYIEIGVGRLAGLELFLPNRSLHDLLAVQVGGLVRRLEECDPQGDRHKDVSRLLKDYEQLEPNLTQVRWAIDAGREFFTEENFELLPWIATDERHQEKLRGVTLTSLA